MQDLHELPKLRDSLSYLYVEHAIIERGDSAVELINKEGRVLVPIAALCLLMLGPGTSITHAAVKVLAENGCSVLWTGEDGIRLYAQGCGETRKAYHLLRQAELASDAARRIQVVLRMYRKRFDVQLEPDLSLPQIRGLEGVRMRKAYALASQAHGVSWQGRRYDRNNWGNSDPINRALSAANALLNGLCHAGIVSGGYSSAIGFIHTGKQMSFVYDIADLYKTKITIPLAFQIVGASSAQVESRVRQACRERFRETKLLDRILPDIDELLGITPGEELNGQDTDTDGALPEDLWEELLDNKEKSPC
jgi:CRISP-associated protein Cas1